MGASKNFVKMSIILTLLYFFFITIIMSCPLVSIMCVVDADTPGAVESLNGKYGIPAKDIPFSCLKTCDDAEYNSELMNVIIYKVTTPMMIIFVISYLLTFGLKRFRKK